MGKRSRQRGGGRGDRCRVWHYRRLPPTHDKTTSRKGECQGVLKGLPQKEKGR